MKREFGRFLKKTRIKAGLTITQVSKKSGLSSPAIRDWETGKRLPNMETFFLWCRAVKVLPEAVIQYARKNSR